LRTRSPVLDSTKQSFRIAPRAGVLSGSSQPRAADEKGAPSPPFDSVLLAAHAQAPTSVSRRQSRSESPPLGRSRISPKADATAAAAARPPWTRSRRAAREPTRARSRWAIRKRARRRSPDLVLVQGGHAPPFGSWAAAGRRTPGA